MRLFLTFTILLSTILLASSCGNISTLEYKTAPVILTAEGPLFEGSNTAQGTVAGADLQAFLGKSGFNGASIKSARLVSAQIFAESDTMNLDNISGITLQLAAPNVDMQQLAVLNPLPAGTGKVSLRVAAEQEKVSSLLQQPDLTCVADINLRQDFEGSLVLKCLLTFELKVVD